MSINGGVALNVRLFGKFEAEIDGVPVGRLALSSADKVLAVLALRHDRDMTKVDLHEVLWHEHEGSDTTPYGPVDASIKRLYKAVGMHSFERTRKNSTWHWRLNESVWVDTVAIERALINGTAEKLVRACQLCRGLLLEGWLDETWAQQESAKWLDSQIHRIERRLDGQLQIEVAEALSALKSALLKARPTVEIAIRRDVRKHLNEARCECQRLDVPLRMANVLLALFQMSDFAESKFNSVQPGYGGELHKWLIWFIRERQIPHDRSTKQRYVDLDWSSYEFIQIAAEEARRERCPELNEKHVLLGVLQSRSSNTAKGIHDKLGDQVFVALLAGIRAHYGTPVVGPIPPSQQMT